MINNISRNNLKQRSLITIDNEYVNNLLWIIYLFSTATVTHSIPYFAFFRHGDNWNFVDADKKISKGYKEPSQSGGFSVVQTLRSYLRSYYLEVNLFGNRFYIALK